VSGKVVDKFEKDGQFVVIDVASEEDHGRVLARGRTAGVARYHPEGGDR
jgi:hypothetical protein